MSRTESSHDSFPGKESSDDCDCGAGIRKQFEGRLKFATLYYTINNFHSEIHSIYIYIYTVYLYT